MRPHTTFDYEFWEFSRTKSSVLRKIQAKGKSTYDLEAQNHQEQVCVLGVLGEMDEDLKI